MENQPLGSKNKKLFILAGAFVLMIIIVVIVASSGKNTGTNLGANSADQNNSAGLASEDASPSAVVSAKNEDLTPAEIANANNLTETQIANLETAKVVVVGANPITKDNIVVTAKGDVTDTAVRSIDAKAPKQTSFLDKATLPKSLLQINVGDGVFTPKEITTTAGAPTSFSLTSTDNMVHVLNFEDSAMSAIVILVGPGQTKAITFNAPAAGSYIFNDSTPGSTAQGTMIVK